MSPDINRAYVRAAMTNARLIFVKRMEVIYHRTRNKVVRISVVQANHQPMALNQLIWQCSRFSNSERNEGRASEPLTA